MYLPRPFGQKIFGWSENHPDHPLDPSLLAGCALRSSVNVGGDRRDTAIHPWGQVTGSYDAFGIKQAVGKVGTRVPTTVWSGAPSGQGAQ
mgnify:CR=1 FL=1|jgi:hypothetical protein